MIFLIAESTLEAFENKLMDLNRQHEIIHTEFDALENIYYARITCKEKLI